METENTIEKEINTKFTLLHRVHTKTKKILEKRNLREINRHKQIFEDKIEEIHALKTKLLEAKIQNGEDDERIEEWENKLDAELENTEAILENIRDEINLLNLEEEKKAAIEKSQYEEECRKKRYDEEKKIEEMKLKLREKMEQDAEG